MDWKMILISQQHQRDLMRQAEQDRMARAAQQNQRSPGSYPLWRALLAAAAQRLQPRPQPDINARRVYTSAKQN